jgi:hypothetical protein
VRTTYGFHAWRLGAVRMPSAYEIERVRRQSARFLADILKWHFADLQHVDLKFLNASLASTSVDYLVAMVFDKTPVTGHMDDIVSVLDNKAIFVDYVNYYLGGIELRRTMFDASSNVVSELFSI